MNISSVGSPSLLQDGQLSSEEFLSIGQDLQGGGKSGPARAMRGEGGFAVNFRSEMMGSLLSMQEAPRDAGEVELARHTEESARRLLVAMIGADGYRTEVTFSGGDRVTERERE